MSTPASASTSATASATPGRLRVDLVTLDRAVLSAECDEITLPGTLGYFGVLPGHAVLVATLGIGVLTIRSGAKRQVFALSGGFCEVRGDVVTVLADQAEAPEQIDVEAAKATIVQAEKLVKAAQDESFVDSMRAMELAQARLAAVAAA